MEAELSCQELVEVVTEYVEGTMAPAERRRFEQHLVYCDGCTSYVQQMRQTIGLVGRLCEDDVPEPAREQLLTVFRHWKAGAQG